jgi:hypothetical protein
MTAVAVIGALLLPGCGTDQPVSSGEIPAPTSYRIVKYGASFITLNDEGGSTLIVKPGQVVVWKNDTDKDQKITFADTAKSVFGIASMVIPKGGIAELLVSKDLAGDETHQHRFSIGDKTVKEYMEEIEAVDKAMPQAVDDGKSTERPVGPPGIIVCPPDKQCG